MRYLIQLCGIGCLLVISLSISGCLGGHTGHSRSAHHANPGFKALHHAPAPAAHPRSFGGNHGGSGHRR